MSTPIQNTVTGKLWEQLDAAMVAAVPIAKEIKAAKAAVDEAEAANQKSGQLRLTLCELEIKKYKEAGDAPGLAQAITVLSQPHFDSYKDVIRHAQARYKANLAGEDIETPGLAATVEKAQETTVAREVETKAAPAKKAAPRKVATKKATAVDPGPKAEDIPGAPAGAAPTAKATEPASSPAPEDAPVRPDSPEPGADDVSIVTPDEPPTKPKTAMSVAEALEKAKARVESEGLRDDSTEEAQKANHAEDIMPASDDYVPNDPEVNPEDVDAYLAGLDEF